MGKPKRKRQEEQQEESEPSENNLLAGGAFQKRVTEARQSEWLAESDPLLTRAEERKAKQRLQGGAPGSGSYTKATSLLAQDFGQAFDQVATQAFDKAADWACDQTAARAFDRAAAQAFGQAAEPARDPAAEQALDPGPWDKRG